MILLELADFNGFYSLAKSIDNNPVLQAYIDRFEGPLIKKILGVELGELFIADIQGEDSDSSAIEDRFQALLDPFVKQDGSYIKESVGMKALLAGLIFYEYVIDDQVKHTQSGATATQAEVSNVASPLEAAKFGEDKWNGSLASIQAIQWLCGSEESDTYPEYAGTYFRPKYSNLL